MRKTSIRVGLLLAAVALSGCDGAGATDPVELSGTWYAQQTAEIAWNIELRELPGDSLRGEGWYGATLLRPSTVEAEGVRDGDQIRLRIERSCCAPATFEGSLIGSQSVTGALLEDGASSGFPLEFTRVGQ